MNDTEKWGSGEGFETRESGNPSIPFSGSWKGKLVSGQVLPRVGHTPPAGTWKVVLGDRRHRLALNHRLRTQFPFRVILAIVLITRRRKSPGLACL